MNISDDLFQLIKSLNQTEKRYFRIYAKKYSKNEENNYMRLFNSIEKQNVYRELALKKQYQDEKFVKQFHVAKNYLYNLILKSLNSYHSEISISSHIRNMINSAEILFDKGLYEQCLKLIEKSRKKCLKYQVYTLIPDLLNLQQQIFFKKSEFEKVKTSLKEEQKILSIHKKGLKYKMLSTKIYQVIVEFGDLRDVHNKEILAELVNNSLLKRAKNANSFIAKYYRFNALAFKFLSENNHAKYNYWLKKSIAFFESFPEAVTNNPAHYIATINNLCNSELYLNNFEDMPELIDKLRSIPENYSANKYNENKMRSFVLSCNLELLLYLESKKYDSGDKIAVRVSELFANYGNKIDTRYQISISYNMSYLFFCNEEYEKSLKWLNLILNEYDLTDREDIHSMSRIFNLIIHYELGNHMLLEYLIKSTYRFLYKRKRLYKTESIILSFIRKQAKLITKDEIRNAFIDVKQELEEAVKDPLEKNTMNYFNLIAWFKCKIDNVSFKEIMNE